MMENVFYFSFYSVNILLILILPLNYPNLQDLIMRLYGKFKPTLNLLEGWKILLKNKDGGTLLLYCDHNQI